MMKLIGFNETWSETNGQLDRTEMASHAKTDQSLLTPRRMSDSYAETILPLGDEPTLRNRYANSNKTVRFGRLLEDLDMFAGI